ncbi:DNA-binding protein [Capilliphycus salinus ALCB114379]|uniref:DNA-binding protein n=1 Tax=Capilliphycus salinus TaxID=2768948 RepID=UPI0039A70CA8
MIVGTTEAARILKISTARLRVLLIAGRVEGAYKTGKMWLIPLFKGKPMIERGTRGPAPRWRNLRKPAKKIVHVNSHRIRQNQKHQEQLPVITVKKGNTNTYGHIVEIQGGCRVVYSPDKPLGCGARVWIETLSQVKIIC